MKNKLLFRKAVTQFFFSLCLMLCCANSSWGQQTIGSFPYMDGGFEGQTTGTLGSVVTAGSWIRATATNGASTINTTGARTGAKFANTTYTLTSGNNRILQSPNSPSTASTDWPTAASHTVQFWIKNSTGTSIPVGVGSTGANYVSPAITSGSGTWLMYTQTVTAASASQAASYAAVRIANAAANFDIDDFVVYLGAADSTPPAAATAAATPISGTTVSWTAALGGVDGGGYMVVRYASNPNIDQDPNQNGIYAKNLSITNGTNGVSNPGTVVYIGTGTSFTDDVAGSSSGTDYYKIYTVDKAFNYAAELIATAVVSSTPAITCSTETLTGFNYTATGPSASQSFAVTGSNLTANLVVSTASTDFELSSDDFATAGTASITLSGATVASTTLYVRLKSNLAGGLKTGSVSVASTGANTLNSISLSGSVQAVYYYNGSGELSAATSWGVNTDGTGANPTAVTNTYTNFVIANGNATTNASWTLGSNSKVIVGNGSAVSLTVADTFTITGTIDAAANGSVVWQHVAVSPTFGTLDNDSEVHFQPASNASYSFGATTAYGKLFIDGVGVVSVSNTASTPTVKTALTVVSGSTLSFSSNANPTISINATATATINGKITTSKAAGLFASAGSIPLIGAATLVLGATSTIEFGRSGSAQTVTGLPGVVSYANLILSDAGSSAAAAKTIAAPFTVNGTLTINLATPAFSTISAANTITMANESEVVMTSGVLGAIPSFASGSKFNVTYNGNGKTQIIGATTISSTNVTLTSANVAIVAGMTVTGTAIPAGTTVASISGTALVLSAAATATSATPTLSFGTSIPQTTGVDLPTVANNALGDLTFDNIAGVVLSSAVKAKYIITAKSNTITLNTADFLDANLQMNGAAELALNVNANQANLKQIVFSAATTAKLKLNMTADTQVTFENSSAQNWGTGTIEIIGFQEGKIKFGTSNTALTATQLGLIKDMGNPNNTFKLSDQGYLYYSSTIIPGDAFVVTSANPLYLALGVASTYSITATNSPTNFVLADATNNPLPAGLTLNPTTGAIEGTPTVLVTDFVVAITISNSVGTTNTINFTFNVRTRDPQTITWSQDFPATNTYGDGTIALTATTDATALSVSYSSSNSAVATISGSTLTIVGPGTTTITASQAGNPDYAPATNLTKELVVNLKPLTIAGAAAIGKVYNQSTVATITGTLAGGLVGSDVVTLVLSGTYADANAGVDKPVTSTSTLTGAAAAKYSLTQPTGLTATITKADQLLAALGTSSFKIVGDADYDPIPLVTDSNITGVASVAIENPNFTYTSSNESVATIVGGKVHIVGLGSTTIIGVQASSINYNESGEVTQILKVLPVPLVAWDLYNFNPTSIQQSVTSVNASQVAAGISVTPSLSMGNMAIITNAGNRYRFTSSDWPYATSSGTVAPINITTGKYMSVAIAADSGKSLSLSSINASFRGGAISSELLSQFAYSIDNGVTYTAIGSPTTFAGASGTRFYSDIDLSGIAALQNLPSGTTVTLRYYASGKSNVTTSTAGQKAWGFFSDFVQNNTRALIIGGTVVTVAPTASAQTFCASATVANLVATGTDLKWYDVETAGTALASTTALATGNYFVSQTVSGSESTRTSVAVTITTPPAQPSLACYETATLNATTCMWDVTGSPLDQIVYYQDVDGDGFGNASATQLACTPPTGYVGNATDCNDAVAAINPGHVEVLYNGIDDNCDGQLDEGFQLTSSLQSVSCGATLTAMGSLVYTDINLSATAYRFKVVNNTTGDIQYVDNNQHWFALNWLSSYDYSTAYTISVQLQIAGVWVGYYGTTCVVNSPDITSSTGTLQLVSSQCGATLPSIATVIYTSVQSGATGYRFRITDVTVGATGANLVQEKERSYHWFTLSMLSRYNYGSTYMVEVAVKTTGGYTGYGSPCYVNTPASPMLNSCGAVIPTSRTLVYTAITKSVTQYRFQVTKVSDQSARTFDTGRFWFSFKVNMPGYTPSVAYSVRVAVMTSGTWSPFGDACEITSPAIPRTDINAELDFTATAFPNPYSDQFSLLVNSDLDERIAYRVYDMLGKLIEADEFDYTALETKEFGRNYPAGVYNIIVTQGENVKTLRVIKR